MRVSDPKTMTEDEYLSHCQNYAGICLSCSEIQQGGCEPDAENYECLICGDSEVQGIENALVSGAITISDSEE